MPGNAAVKSTAKVALRQFWPQAIAACLLFIAVLFVPYVVASVNTVVMGAISVWINAGVYLVFCVVVGAPTFLGVLRYFRRAVYGNVDSLGSLFYYFTNKKRYKNSVWFAFMLAFRLLLVAAITFLPYLIVKILEFLPIKLFSGSVIMQVGIVRGILFLFGAVFFVVTTARYYISPMLFVSCEDMHWTEAFYLSKHISKYSTGPFLVLLVGFVGWILLSVCGFTLIYTAPYMLTAYVVHCRYAFSRYNHNIEIMKETDFPEYRSDF